MLQDAIWADGTRLARPGLQRHRRRRSSRPRSQGWAYCRDNAEACATSGRRQGSTLGASHQLWQMNEINKLIWPAAERRRLHRHRRVGPHGRDRQETQEPRGQHGAHQAPDAEAFTNDIVNEASHACSTAARCRHQRHGFTPDRRHPDRGRRLTERSTHSRRRAGRLGGPPFSRRSSAAPCDLRGAVEHRVRRRPLRHGRRRAAHVPRRSDDRSRRRCSAVVATCTTAPRVDRRIVQWVVRGRVGHARRCTSAACSWRSTWGMPAGVGALDRRPASGDHRGGRRVACSASACVRGSGSASRSGSLV